MAHSFQAHLVARVALVALASLLLTVTTADAASRSMTGSLMVDNVDAGIEGGPGVFGRKVGGAGPRTFPPTDGAKTIAVAGTTAGTFVGRPITLAASQLNFSGAFIRKFPAFDNVGQVTKTWMSIQEAATFATGNGALGACPGPGCTASGAGTAISWCPPFSNNPTAPAPGTTGAPIGDWDCPSWPAGFGGGNNGIRMGISNLSGRPNFGGTLSLLRNFNQNVWRVPVQPSTPNASDAEVTRSWMQLTNQQWTPGRPNFQFTSLGGNNGPRLLARIDGSGAVAETFGCANGVGTNGGDFNPGVPIIGPGSNCGTNPEPNAAGLGWGFKLTTGTVSGSDPYPFGLVITTLAGTPFNPVFQTQPASLGFFFSRMGTDTVTPSGNERNIVMLGGGLAVDPDSGNSFFRIMDLRMSMSVPEPAAALGLLTGAGALIALARRRRS
jgi:hypothetical protein